MPRFGYPIPPWGERRNLGRLRRTIEREENEQRKPLTDYERSKRLVSRAVDEGPTVDRRISEVSGHHDQKPHSGGRPSKYGAPAEDVAKALGVAEKTLRRAEAHVAAAEEKGVPDYLPQATALKVATHCRKRRPLMRRILACPRCQRVAFVWPEHGRVRCPACYHYTDAANTAAEVEHVTRHCIGCLRERDMATAFGWCLCTTCGCSRPLGLLIGDPEAGGVYWTVRQREARKAGRAGARGA